MPSFLADAPDERLHVYLNGLRLHSAEYSRTGTLLTFPAYDPSKDCHVRAQDYLTLDYFVAGALPLSCLYVVSANDSQISTYVDNIFVVTYLPVRINLASLTWT